MKQSTSNPQRLHSRRWRAVLALIAAMGLIAGMFGIVQFGTFPKSVFAATGQEPCDIYASYGTSCVAAHSTVRALYTAYNGPLYQIQRSSDGQYLDIGLLAPGGYANATPQVSFCANTTCTITKIYDQSPEHNDLPISTGGYWKGPGPNGSDLGANAMALPVTVGGHQVYGVKINPGMGYRIYHTKGVATGSQPQGAYMVTSSSNVNSGCCFDYGNAETDGGDDGNGTMDAVYFGTLCWFGYVVPDPPCAGSGPWVMADMENGLFAGGNGSNTNNLGNKSPFVTALVKNNGTTTYAIKGGNAQSGGLTTWYNGSLPTQGGYMPMKQQGSIILGTGGDNSNGSSGEFFEGLMTAGYPSDAADNAVQANVVAAGYGSTTPPPSPTPTTPTPTPTPNGTGYAVNAGGPAVGNFAADEFYDTGSTYSTTATINTSAVSNPAPQSVYQTERYGNVTYTLPGLVPGKQYTVRLHESENYWTSSGQRTFNVSINGQQVLTNFDIFAAAGGADKAIVEQFPATADASGTITIQFTGVKDNAKVDGIELIGGSSSTPTPTPTPTNTPTPTPTSGTGGMACSVQYAVTNQWQGGFGTSITINNTGSTTINGWTLTWTFANGQTITQIWNATDTQTGGTVSATNVSYNGTIAPGGNTNFGFNGSWNSSNAAPTAFSLNGTACAMS